MSITVTHLTASANASPEVREQLFIADGTDLVVSLPQAHSTTKGHTIALYTGTLSVTVGFSASPATGDTIYAKGITAAASKDLINTGATDAVGDTIVLVSDGAAAWFCTGMLGTWEREA